MNWLDTIIQGVLLGGLYALFAAGLSLVFGIMRLVNLAHGDLIVLAAFLIFALVTVLGLNPFLATLVAIPIMFGLGWILQSQVLNRTLGPDILPPLLVTFGLSVIIENVLLEAFGADNRRLQAGALETQSIAVGGIAIGVYPLIVFATAIVAIAGLQLLFYRTTLGRAFRATSDDAETAELMGIDNRHLYALGLAIAMIFTALAGVLMAIRTNFDPAAGPIRLIFAFEAVIIGGLGSLWGTLLGGMVLGIAQAIGAALSPTWQILAGHIAFLIILIIRPSGFFPRTRD
jgi:branched-chain amino acid transport system permease protein